MAESTWQQQMTIVVRSLINDLDSSTYDDGRIQQMIVVSSQLLKTEIDFLNTYTINIAQISISPDPVDNLDDGFITLVSMKAAILILLGELKLLAGNNVRVQDASASIDMTQSYVASKNLYDQLCKDFDKAKISYVLGNLNEIKAILSPYTVPYNIYPSIQFG